MSSHFSRRTRLGVETLEGRAVPAAHAAYAVTADWGTGFQAQVTISNDGPTGVAFDKLQFSLPSNIVSVSDAKVVAHVGNQYTVTNAGWDAVVPAGGAVTFGFTATGASTAAGGFVLNGVSVEPVVPPVVPPAVPPVVPTATGVQATYKTTGDWGTGLAGEITIKNTGTVEVKKWTLTFDFAGPITSLWNGVVLSHVGTRYTVGPTAWNATIPVGGSVVIGFSAGVGGATATNLAVTGDTIVPPPPPANHAPLAAKDDASTKAGQAVMIAVLANDTDADGDALAVTAVGSATHGKLTRNANGTVTYTPAPGFVGIDTFTYAVSDGRGGTSVGKVTVLVSASSWLA